MKRLPLSIATLLVLSAQVFAANGEDRNQNVVPTNLAGTRTIAAPPASFDPLTAGDEELAYWGFPPRPNPAESPEDYAGWAQAIRASKTRIIPKLAEGKPWHGHYVPSKGIVADGKKTISSGNWSGYVHPNGVKKYGSDSFFYVMADSIVPVAQQAFGTCSGSWDYTGNWIGLGGFEEVPIVQAGFEYDAYCNGGSTQTNYSAWYEFFPNNQTYITNMPLSPGDNMYMQVWQTSPVEGHAYLVNLTTDTSVYLDFDAPAGYALVGNSAEWITERPGGNELTNFVSDFFWNADAYTKKDKKFVPGESTPIVMTDDSENEIVFPTKISNTTFQMQDMGSAY